MPTMKRPETARRSRLVGIARRIAIAAPGLEPREGPWRYRWRRYRWIDRPTCASGAV
jgi:hypothetical protein